MARRRAFAVAVAVLGLLYVAPGVALAAPPVCPDGIVLETDTDVALQLPKPVCPGVVEPAEFRIALGGLPLHGMISEPDPGVFVYTPAAKFHGRDQFKYEVKSSTGEVSAPATVTVIVDSGPSCTSILVAAPANGSMTIDLPCSDPDNEVLDLFVSKPAHGTATVAGSKVVYTPTPGYSGPDSFGFYAEDEFYSSNDATVSISVSPPPTPVATVIPPPPPPVLRDTTAPSLALKNAAKKQRLAIAVTTNENVSATLTVALDKATARKLKLTQNVGSLKTTLKAGSSTLKLKLSAKAAKAFKKLKSVKLTVTADITDTAGNKTSKTLKVTLKR